MGKKTLILTETQLDCIIDNILNEQVYTDFDKAWDYKLSGDMWYTSRKGANKWISLKNYPAAIKKLNDRYQPKPVRRAAQNVVNTAQNTTDRAIERTRANASTFPDRLRARGEQIGNKLRSTGKSIGNKVDAVGDTIGDKVRSTGDAIGDKVRSTGDAIGDKVRSTGDAIGDKTREGVGDIKGFMRKLSPNVAQMFFTRSLTGNDFSKKQRNVIYNVIQNAIKRGRGKNRGSTDYSDYGGKIKTTFDTRSGASTKDIILKSATDPYFQVASTLGAFTYQLRSDGTYLVTDTYDFTKGIGYTATKEELAGMSYLEQMSFVMKKDNLTPYRAARQIAYIEHPNTADESDKVKIRLTINPKEFVSRRTSSTSVV